MADGSKGANIAAWILSVLLALVFVGAGGMKLAGSEEVATGFAKMGYPVWFSYLIGLIEVGGGLLLLVPRLATYGAALLIVIMLGAIVSVLRVGDSFVPPLVVGLLLGVVAYLRRSRLS